MTFQCKWKEKKKKTREGLCFCVCRQLHHSEAMGLFIDDIIHHKTHSNSTVAPLLVYIKTMNPNLSMCKVTGSVTGHQAKCWWCYLSLTLCSIASWFYKKHKHMRITNMRSATFCAQLMFRWWFNVVSLNSWDLNRWMCGGPSVLKACSHLKGLTKRMSKYKTVCCVFWSLRQMEASNVHLGKHSLEVQTNNCVQRVFNVFFSPIWNRDLSESANRITLGMSKLSDILNHIHTFWLVAVSTFILIPVIVQLHLHPMKVCVYILYIPLPFTLHISHTVEECCID